MLQAAYDAEINFRIETFFDSGISVLIFEGFGKMGAGHWVEIYQGYSFEEGIEKLYGEIKKEKL
jgi:hypothetical protein